MIYTLRWLWACAVVAATIASLFFVVGTWKSYTESPPVTLLENPQLSTWNIPFPAITVCSVNRISKMAALKLAETMKRPSNISKDRLANMFSLITHFHGLTPSREDEYRELNEVLRQNNVSVATVMASVAPDCFDLLKKCSWKGVIVQCVLLFRVIKTSEGICCSFNYHATDLDYTER